VASRSKKVAYAALAANLGAESLTMHIGPDYILVNLSMRLAPRLAATRVLEIDGDVKRRYPKVRRFFIEAQGARRA
jgi:hypothetical protein